MTETLRIQLRDEPVHVRNGCAHYPVVFDEEVQGSTQDGVAAVRLWAGHQARGRRRVSSVSEWPLSRGGWFITRKRGDDAADHLPAQKKSKVTDVID